MEIISNSPQQTQDLAAYIGQIAQPGTVIVLEGSLGAGKTSFVQGLARGLGITGRVNSPTFTIIKEYNGRLPLYHFDLYRLEEPEELWELGLDEFFTSGGVCALEWGERAQELLPRERLDIHLEHQGDSQRSLLLRPQGEFYQDLVRKLMEYAHN